jgi:hypothetical protein
MEKKCRKCKEVKDISFFGKESRTNSGYKSRCKKCCNEQYKIDYPKYRDAKLNQLKVYYSVNADSIKFKSNQAYKKQDPEHRKLIKSKWREKNRQRLRERQNNYIQERIKTDPVFRTDRKMRTLIYRLIKDKTERTSVLLGYTSIDLMNLLGSDIQSKHIDHKIPLSWFVSGTDIKIINSLSNLQLLSQSDNVKKHNCFAHPISEDYYSLIKPHIKIKYINQIKTL